MHTGLLLGPSQGGPWRTTFWGVTLIPLATLCYPAWHVHRDVGIAAAVLYAISWVAMARVMCTDPGILKKQTREQLQQQLNSMEQDPVASQRPRRRICEKCNILRPPLAHHCDECGACIRGLDHHCPWTGHCIGERNIYSFYFFLTTLYLQLFFVIIVLGIFVTRIDDSRSGY